MRERESSGLFFLALALAAALFGGAAGYAVFYFGDLPQVEQLEEYRPSVTSRMYAADGTELARFYIENRSPVPLAEVPQEMINALIAAEDAHFYSHHGIDFRGMARAMLRNIRAGKVLEGGSTLTQQLAKVLFLTPERSYTRKLKEMALALRIEQHYTKREILSFYLNQIYFGSGAYGIEAASRIYFGKSVKQLDLAECALLAGLPRSPRYYSPFKSLVGAKRRRSYVLNRMVADGFISSAAAAAAKQEPLPTTPPPAQAEKAPYFVEYVRQRVEDRFGSGILYSGGLRITTSLDPRLQTYAEEAIASGLERIEKRTRHKHAAPLQAALIAIEPSSGLIRAMVGGRDFASSQFNRACQAMRQPGSAFKPIIYADALAHGIGASELFDDSPLVVKTDHDTVWRPMNFTRTYLGPVTMRQALEQSLNIPTVRLLERIGIDSVITFARRIGITSPLSPYLSLALGSSVVSLSELTSAYAVFADHGLKLGPASIITVADRNGVVVYRDDAIPQVVMKPETAYLITYLLEGAIERGTGWEARSLGRPAAGKTGTTNDYHDAWFIGYTPNLVTGVWVGYDDSTSIGPRQTGARAALPIWLDFAKKALAGTTPKDFSVPQGVIFRDIDRRTGLLASETCGPAIREAYLPGTEPRTYCQGSSPQLEEPEEPDEAP